MHLKHIPRWLFVIGLIAVILSTLVLASTSATVQEDTDAKDKTEKLFSLLQKANVTMVEIFRQLRADAKTIPQASLTEYNQALTLTSEAESLMQAGNYSEAESKIIQALQKLKKALSIIYTTVPEQPTETELAFETAAQLKSSIDRYSEQLQRIENLTCFATAAGFNTTTLENQIQTIKALLDNAASNTAQKRFEAASVNLAEAKVLIEKLVNALTDIAVNLKIQRLQTYIAQTEVRLATIKETATSLSNIASLTALNNAETSLNTAKEYLEKQKINETLSELANSRASEEEAVAYLKPVTSSSNLTSSRAPSAVQVP